MKFEFINRYPSLYLKKSRTVVVADIHIGKELKLLESGINFLNASENMADVLLKICKDKKSKSLIIIGDLKDSILYPDKKEYNLIKAFFDRFEGFEIRVAKGNHDSHLEEIFKLLRINAIIEKEIFIEDAVLLHGNALPSEEAMNKKIMFSAHAHAIIEKNNNERVWLKAPIGFGAMKYYKQFNPKEKLILVPHFNNILSGLDVSRIYNFMPIFRNNIFDFKKISIFDLEGKRKNLH